VKLQKVPPVSSEGYWKITTHWRKLLINEQAENYSQ
jgi:hypothetical protein